jgi:hypothetical protein
LASAGTNGPSINRSAVVLVAVEREVLALLDLRVAKVGEG